MLSTFAASLPRRHIYVNSDPPQSQLKELMNKMQDEGLPKPKPWSEFFSKFTPPKKEDLLSRFHCNLIYYPTNYLIVAAVVLTINM